MKVTFRLRRDTAANWTAANPVLALGEPGHETDTRRKKTGDGTTPWNTLLYDAASVAWGGITGTLTDQTDLATALAAKVPATRAINTTAPLTGGGDLSANRTLAISPATQSSAGSLSAVDKIKLDNTSGVNTGDNANTTGNAGTATKLQAPRNIAGKSFDGTSDIAIADTDLSGAAWTAFTPSAEPASGAFASVQTSGRYKTIGKTVFVQITVTIANNGSGAGFIRINGLPFAGGGPAGAQYALAGRESSQVGFNVNCSVPSGSTTLAVFKYDGSYPGATGYVLQIAGVYERP